ncbi:MAG: transaldolase family protein [Chloroflexota bacterium]
MAIYLDSAKLEEARQARELGWVYGITTNPSLMAKAGVEPHVVLRELNQLRFNEVYYQLTSPDPDEMLLEARKASELVRNLVLKLAPTEDGFRFVAQHGNEFPCCITAIFDPSQALVARAAGARYIAVYVNRATKQLGDGLTLVKSLANVLAGSQTQILAASLKSTKEAVDAFLAGAHHITVPFELLVSLSNHQLSQQTVEQFNTEGVGITLKP